MKKNNKIISKITIILLILISIFALYNIHNSTAFRLDEVLLRDSSSNSSMFAIMVENDDGEYEQYTDSTSWPTNMSFNEELSGCVDDDGNTVEGILSFSDGLATVNTTKTVYCYLYFDKVPDIIVTTTVNGTESDVPTTGSYTVNTTSGSYWSEKYRTLNITSTNSTTAKYTLTFTTDSSTKTYLRDYIVSLLGTSDSVTSGNGYLVDEEIVYYEDYTNATTLTEADYGTTSQFYSSSASATSGTSTSVWSYADGIWTSDSESMTSGTYYHLSTIVGTSGYYQMCYSVTSGSTSNRLYAYVDGTAQTLSDYAYVSSSSAEKSDCVNFGYIESGTTVEFVQYAYTTISSMSVSLELGIEDSRSVGIRYEGANPNNYVWFNNEMWRIIGVIPTVVDEDGTVENLVKIIRNEDIGSYAHDGRSGYSGFWGSNTLYTLLNSYYWGASDGTGTSYCMGYQTYALPNCDYTNIGISSTSYYGSMVQYVYWNTGFSSFSITPSTAYYNELGKQTVGGYIGIMNLSDFGYAYYSTDHSTTMNNYATASITSLNWLYRGSNIWILNVSSRVGGKVNGTTSEGKVREYYANYGAVVYPILYLNSNVYIVDGTGSESDPYILGID